MNCGSTFIPKKVLGRLGFRYPIHLIREYIKSDIFADMSKLKVSMTSVVMSDHDWCLLISYLEPIMKEYNAKHPEVERAVQSGALSVESMFTQLVFTTEGGEITSSCREQGTRLPSYFMQDSRIGLTIVTVPRRAHDASYVNLMKGCVLDERMLHDKFGGADGRSFFLFYDSFSSTMHRPLFTAMLKDAGFLEGGILLDFKKATHPIIKILSNKYVQPTRSHSKSLAGYLCRDSDNLYTVDVELTDVFSELLINSTYIDKGNVHGLAEARGNFNREFAVEPARTGIPSTTTVVPESSEAFHEAAETTEESSAFDSKMAAASLKRPVNPTVVEKVTGDPEIAPPKKKKSKSDKKVLDIQPVALPHDI
jgi:hypothetical protein